jgi:protein-S-isoprenylcysteine O-methyltransferase Ste14
MHEDVMVKKLKRWLLASGIVGVSVFTLAGTLRDPWLWAYKSVWSIAAGYALFSIDEDLARERVSPPNAGADGLALNFVRAVALAHLIVGALDSGRWHLTSPVPPGLRAFALVAMAATVGMFYRAMRENRFFSAVVRVQSERGHRVIDSGPYSIVRHPGYAGLLLATPFSGLALGSWIAAAIGLVMSAMILRRVMFEDAFLQKNLDGYAAYTDRVRHRLIPGVW